jgi:ribonuclease P protein component
MVHRTSSGSSFGASARLKKRRDFVICKETGHKVYAKHFLLLICASVTHESRLGVTVTTKIDKRAVVRNRIKRRIREVFRLNRASFARPIDIVVVARRDSGGCTFQDSEREILGALRYHGYLTRNPGYE